jgi:hypothetical protein
MHGIDAYAPNRDVKRWLEDNMKDCPVWLYLVLGALCSGVLTTLGLMDHEPYWQTLLPGLILALFLTWALGTFLFYVMRRTVPFSLLAKSPTQLQKLSRRIVTGMADSVKDLDPHTARELRKLAQQTEPFDQRSRTEKIAVLCVLILLLLGIVGIVLYVRSQI